MCIALHFLYIIRRQRCKKKQRHWDRQADTQQVDSYMPICECIDETPGYRVRHHASHRPTHDRAKGLLYMAVGTGACVS